MMGPWTSVLVAILALTPAKVQKDGVQIEVEVRSHIYIWKVTNLNAGPITSFEVEQTAAEQEVPAGWEMEVEGRRFHAWTTDIRHAITASHTKLFTARFATSGAVLGPVPASVGLEFGNRTVEFERVWGPVPKRRGMVVLVAAMVAGIVGLHVLVLERKERRDKGTKGQRD